VGRHRWVRNQGDQIGRIFADWVIGFMFGQIFESNRGNPLLRLFFPWLRICIEIDGKMVGQHFRRFKKTVIWSPWLGWRVSGSISASGTSVRIPPGCTFLWKT
jgi:hypothetical protein